MRKVKGNKNRRKMEIVDRFELHHNRRGAVNFDKQIQIQYWEGIALYLVDKTTETTEITEV